MFFTSPIKSRDINSQWPTYCCFFQWPSSRPAHLASMAEMFTFRLQGSETDCRIRSWACTCCSQMTPKMDFTQTTPGIQSCTNTSKRVPTCYSSLSSIRKRWRCHQLSRNLQLPRVLMQRGLCLQTRKSFLLLEDTYTGSWPIIAYSLMLIIYVNKKRSYVLRIRKLKSWKILL